MRAVTSRLRWILREDETLVAVARSGGWLELERCLIFTSPRIFVVREGKFLSDGAVDQELPWTSVHVIAKVLGSDRGDGFDLGIEHGPAEKRDVRTFALRDSSLAVRGEEFVERLTACLGEKRRVLESAAG